MVCLDKRFRNLIIIAAVLVLAFFLVNIFSGFLFDAKKEAENMKSIISKYGVNPDSDSLLADFAALDEAKLTGIKAELEGSRKFLIFFDKPGIISGRTDIMIEIINLAYYLKKYEEYDSLAYSNIADPCGQIENIKKRNEFEEKTVMQVSALQAKAEEYSGKYLEKIDLKMPAEIAEIRNLNSQHKSSLQDLIALCEG